MALKVIGAGLGRTGTHSLKIALEKLLGGTCYHMVEVFQHPEHMPLWLEAARGTLKDWSWLGDNYTAEVDWPASAFYKELMEEYPDALVLLSTRSPESWWKSASNTIFKREGLTNPEFEAWIGELFQRRFVDIRDPEVAKAAFVRHNEEVIATVPAERLVVWTATDGWAPICNALNIPIPDEPFPLTNTTEEFQARRTAGLPGAPAKA